MGRVSTTLEVPLIPKLGFIQRKVHVGTNSAEEVPRTDVLVKGDQTRRNSTPCCFGLDGNLDFDTSLRHVGEPILHIMTGYLHFLLVSLCNTSRLSSRE